MAAARVSRCGETRVTRLPPPGPRTKARVHEPNGAQHRIRDWSSRPKKPPRARAYPPLEGSDSPLALRDGRGDRVGTPRGREAVASAPPFVGTSLPNSARGRPEREGGVPAYDTTLDFEDLKGSCGRPIPRLRTACRARGHRELLSDLTRQGHLCGKESRERGQRRSRDPSERAGDPSRPARGQQPARCERVSDASIGPVGLPSASKACQC
jgi:hypothetical protein